MIREDDRTTKLQHFAGYDFETNKKGTKVLRERIDLSQEGDYGADPLGDGRFRMVPSGDVVDVTEKRRRLGDKQ